MLFLLFLPFSFACYIYAGRDTLFCPTGLNHGHGARWVYCMSSGDGIERFVCINIIRVEYIVVFPLYFMTEKNKSYVFLITDITIYLHHYITIVLTNENRQQRKHSDEFLLWV